MKNNPREVGNRIKLIRTANRLTQTEMANIMGVSGSQLSKIEVGLRNIGMAPLKLLCSEFDVSEDWILTGEGKGFIPVDAKTFVRESRAVYSAKSRAGLAGNWADEFCGIIRKRQKTIEAAVNDYSLTFERAIEPAVREFLERGEKGSGKR